MRVRLATRLMLVSRDPDSGRLPGGRSVAAVSRAALLGELIATHRLAPHPAVAGPGRRAGEPAGDHDDEPDRILDAVLAAVQRRPGVPWRRWFTHVEADRHALIDELLAAGRWSQDGSGRFTDTDPEATEADRRRLTAISVRAETPHDLLDALGGCLLLLLEPRATRPSPKAVRRDWTPVLQAAAGDAERVAAVMSVVEAAASGRRRRQRGGGLFSLRR